MRDGLLKHGWLLAWLVLVLIAYLVRNPVPIDETRYLGVAWEMWLRGDFLVPHLNGEPYSHKPPMLFWLFHLGWTIFGVNTWWPRLVPPLLTLAALFFTQSMAKRLWPDRPQVAMLAPWVLCGSVFWSLYFTATMFDMLLTAIVMLALLGLLRAGAGYMRSGWLLVGIAIGLGILSKGPVMLLHIAFPALLAPWWNTTARQRPVHWYVFLLLALLLGAGIALAWALPAAAAGGTAYKQAILWHQTADRMVSSFAHRQPFWWYLPLLPVLLFPWFIWPPLWRAIKGLRLNDDLTIRFLLCWLLPTFIAFSLISGKQPQYLLPLFPGFALLAVRSLDGQQPETLRRDQLWPVLLTVVAGFSLLLLPQLSDKWQADWMVAISPAWGLAIMLVGATLLLPKRQQVSRSIVTLAVTVTIVSALLMGGIFVTARPVFDIAPAAQVISRLQEQGAPIANVGKYYNQFHFLGRLKKPLVVITEARLKTWRKSHPGGYVVMYQREATARDRSQAVYTQRYRGQWLLVWAVNQMGKL